MSPFFMAATAASACGPTQSAAKPTGRLTMRATSAATGSQRILRIAALGAVEMGEEDDPAALAGKLGNGRRDFLDTG